MSTPTKEFPQTHFAPLPISSDDEGTLSGEYDRYNQRKGNDARSYVDRHVSQSRSREEQHRLGDDLAMLQAEQVVSKSQSPDKMGAKMSHSLSMRRSRSRPEPVDQFDVNTNPIHEKTATFRPPENPSNNVARAFKRIHDSSFLIRYFLYIMPVVTLLLIPLLLGALVLKRANVGGVRLMWFSVWLEIVWLTLWGARIVAKALPWPLGIIASLFTNNSKKWKDMCRQLEIPATLFFWALSVEISFLPVMIHNHLDGGKKTRPWEITMNKIIISLFIGATLNLVEKIVIQLIAISFHLRTYADRIEINKFQIGSLTKLYEYSKEKITMDDSEFEEGGQSGPASGARTPMQYFDKAQKKSRNVLSKVGDAAGKVAGDFTGRQITKSTHPRQVVLTLLSSTSGSQVLARRLYRTFVQEDAETILSEDLKNAFANDEEAESAFSMFDKDLNGDISMNELEAACVEIGRERKSITASLKDLDSVVSKLDAVLLFFVFIITVLVLISLISTSAAGMLTSAGSAVLALSWLFSGTAQEFLSSCIFVLIKHPFDCGDRVYLYGNSGTTMKGDDYFVKEISLLYTEFKKMEGHIVQAPNSYLNTLFILNMRRSGGLAEAVPLTVKFGTTLDQIDDLRRRLLEFVKLEKREYQPNILTEIREVVEAHSVNLNVVFFYKSNWQNELLRLQRRNKFICALMISMQEVGIEGPRMRIAGQKEETPFYYQHAGNHNPGCTGPVPQSGCLDRENTLVSDHPETGEPHRSTSILQHPGRTNRNTRNRGESITEMSKRIDFSLGMKDVSSDMMGDLYENVSPVRVTGFRRNNSPSSRNAPRTIQEEDDHAEYDLGRTTSQSRFSLNRTSTGSRGKVQGSHSVIHRNRFFSKRNGKEQSGSEYEDLMEQGMADIPEGFERIDPRSGVVSPQAVRVYTEPDFSRMDFSKSQSTTSGALPNYAKDEERNDLSRDGSEAFELRTMVP
ncbi:hypothetical protein MMC07_004285 [Pseudocyphellaria aurata]|nr:hypothetical protein [Pseudocyphellaria aurata]